MNAIRAWVLDAGEGGKVAVSMKELLHLIDQPVVYPVPCTPEYCRSVVSWQGRLLPVMDIAARLGRSGLSGGFVAVLGYQMDGMEEVRFGAVRLNSPPRQISVSDEMACGLPDEWESASGLALSCVEYDAEFIPILNIASLYSEAPE